MAKKIPLETDIARLKEKVRAKAASTDNPEGDASFRALRKRLKRAQRKRRRQVIRKGQAMGKKGEAKAEAASS